MSDSIRAVQRALSLVRLMNECEFWTLHQLSIRSHLAKATLHRILQTLEAEGYVHAPMGKVGLYRLTSLTRELSCGVTRYSLFADVAEPIVIAGTKAVRWPLSFAMEEGAFMRIVACGMPYSPLSARTTSVGCRHGMLSSAVGQVYLAHCGASERHSAICAAVKCNPQKFIEELSFKDVIAEIKRCGYAARYGSATDVNSAFAVPVRSKQTVYGALACSTSKRLLSKRFIADMFGMVTDVALQLAASLDQLQVSSNVSEDSAGFNL